MRRELYAVYTAAFVVGTFLSAGVAHGVVVGLYEMEVDDNTGVALSVADSSGTLGANPFVATNAAIAAPGADGTANGVDGFNNVNGTIASYEALNSASLTVSAYFRTNEATALLIGRTPTTPTNDIRLHVAPNRKGFAIESPNNVTALFWINDVLYQIDGGANPINLSAGTIEAPAWTKVTFSYNAVTGEASLLADDALRGSLTVPGGGPMFVAGDVINVLAGNAAYVGGGFDGGDMASNLGGLIDQIKLEDAPVVVGVPGDVDGDEDVDIFDFHAIRDHFQQTVTMRTEGDLTGDLFVDFRDFRQWKTHALSVALAEYAGLTIPEPSTAALVGVAMAAALARRRTGVLEARPWAYGRHALPASR